MQVNYVGKTANIYETGYQLKGSAYVISKYISNIWLWNNIRGREFGGFFYFDTSSGKLQTHPLQPKPIANFFVVLKLLEFPF